MAKGSGGSRSEKTSQTTKGASSVSADVNSVLDKIEAGETWGLKDTIDKIVESGISKQDSFRLEVFYQDEMRKIQDAETEMDAATKQRFLLQDQERDLYAKQNKVDYGSAKYKHYDQLIKQSEKMQSEASNRYFKAEQERMKHKNKVAPVEYMLKKLNKK